MSGSRPERLDVRASQSRLLLKLPTALVSCGLLGSRPGRGLAGGLHVPGPPGRKETRKPTQTHLAKVLSPTGRVWAVLRFPEALEREAGSAQNTVCSKGTGQRPKRHPGPGRARGPPEDAGGARRSGHLGMGSGPRGRASPAHPRRRSPRQHPTFPARCAPKNRLSRALGRTPGAALLGLAVTWRI